MKNWTLWYINIIFQLKIHFALYSWLISISYIQKWCLFHTNNAAWPSFESAVLLLCFCTYCPIFQIHSWGNYHYYPSAHIAKCCLCLYAWNDKLPTSSRWFVSQTISSEHQGPTCMFSPDARRLWFLESSPSVCSCDNPRGNAKPQDCPNKCACIGSSNTLNHLWLDVMSKCGTVFA